MNNKPQDELKKFREHVLSFNTNDKTKVAELKQINSLINDPKLAILIKKREDFLLFCQNGLTKLEKPFKDKFLDKFQKDYFLQLDFLRKEGLSLMATNQVRWFEQLFQYNFPSLKLLMRNLLVNGNDYDIATMERVIQEIELLHSKQGYSP